ncbi:MULTISPECIES: replication initiator protein A [unclassified Streptococcus]|uniref:replication initiator protein A n=1 Tax=unclassified Streptococcus TaxID=2608887 RepID=UPI002889A24F|nr:MULTISPECIES: replication initiator protein A [unclassified Streptococcus]
MKKHNKIKEEELVRQNFFMTPYALYRNPAYKGLSNDAKTLYALMLDRVNLSVKNRGDWTDENGEVYCYFKVESAMEFLEKSKQYIIKLKKELHDFGLLLEIKQGLNKPNRIYPLKIDVSRRYSEKTSGSIKNARKYTRETSGGLSQGLLEERERDSNHTNINHTNINHTEIPSAADSGNTLYSIGAENNSATADFNVYEYYQERIGLLDGFQFQQLKAYRDLDGLETELIKIAIDKAADNSKRSFRYVESILKNWVQNGIRTVARQQEDQREFENSKNTVDRHKPFLTKPRNNGKAKFGPACGKY